MFELPDGDKGVCSSGEVAEPEDADEREPERTLVRDEAAMGIGSECFTESSLVRDILQLEVGKKGVSQVRRPLNTSWSQIRHSFNLQIWPRLGLA